jgi:hypothetical protein
MNAERAVMVQQTDDKTGGNRNFKYNPQRLTAILARLRYCTRGMAVPIHLFGAPTLGGNQNWLILIRVESRELWDGPKVEQGRSLSS